MSQLYNCRVPWIDNVKFIAIIMVILGHSFALIKGDFYGYDEINLFIVAFNMPLFALISGITAHKSLSKISTWDDLMAYISKIAWHIGVPTVIYTLIAMLIGYGLQMRWERFGISGAMLIFFCLTVYFVKFKLKDERYTKLRAIFPLLYFPIFLINQSVWYFVYVIICLFSASVSAFLANKISKYSILIFCFLFAAISYLTAPLSPFSSTIEFYLPFVIGYLYAARYGLKIFSIRVIPKLALFVFLVAIGVFSFVNYYSITNQFYLLYCKEAFMQGQITIFILRQVAAISLSFAILILIQFVSNSYTKISVIGAMTMGIYPIHSEIIAILKSLGFCLEFDNILLRLISLFILSILLLMSSIAIIKILRKTGYTTLLFLGE